MGKKAKEKFSFDIDFQELILKYILSEKKGYKVLELIDDSYFSLINHSIIVLGINKYYKKYKKIPSLPSLKETIRVIYSTDRNLSDDLTLEDKQEIENLLPNLYKGDGYHGDEIVNKVVNFARYVRFKSEMESVDINNYDSYEAAIQKLTQANRVGFDVEASMGTFVIGGIEKRAYSRNIEGLVSPSPFWQLNQLSNAGGFMDSPVVMLVAEAKRFKTGSLINVAVSYAKRKKKVVYFDFENGEELLTVRSEQSILGVEQKEIFDGGKDEALMNLLKRYKRIGAEIVIKRMVAYRDTTEDMQSYLNTVKAEYGITFDVCIIDFPDLMASTSGKKEEFDRISDAYVDVKNFAKENQFESTWIASHTTREASKRRGTVYVQNDLAKCIDKIRHVDLAIGIQESEDEIEAGVMRWEIIEQRNGTAFGKCLFWVDIAKQKLTEFTKAQVKKYLEQTGQEAPKKKSEPTKRKTDLD